MSKALLEFVQRYGPPAGSAGPVLFAQEVFGATLDEWQIRTLRAYGMGERRISMRACHGPGKTFVLNVMAWHQMLCRFPQKTVVTAPSVGQLEDALVAEVLKWGQKLPPALRDLFEFKKNRIELRAAPNESFFSARTARAENPEALQGVHADPGFVLLIADEASGIPEAIYEAAAGSMSGHNATTVLASNPTRTSGFFFDTHHKLSDMWFTVHISYKDSSRVSEDFAHDIARRYGESSNAYRVRVLGEFPLSDLDTVIPYEMAASAQGRDIIVPPNLRDVWGVDVARFGDDFNALVKRNSLAVSPDIMRWGGFSLMETAGKIHHHWKETPDHKRPSEILIDVIGMGGGVVDRLLELGLPVRGINVSEAASYNEKYRNLRTELWFKAREWLETRDHVLPLCDGRDECARDCVHQMLISELTIPKYSFTSTGKLAVEGKKEIKSRGFSSPNVAEAFLMTLATEPATIIRGSQGAAWGGGSWNEPIRSGRVVV